MSQQDVRWRATHGAMQPPADVLRVVVLLTEHGRQDVDACTPPTSEGVVGNPHAKGP